MTGVTPAPAVTKRTFSGTGSGRWKSPPGAESRMMRPGRSRSAMRVDMVPSGTGFTEIVSRRSLRCRRSPVSSGALVSE